MESFYIVVIKNYTNQDMVQFLKRTGIASKRRKRNRIFPVTNQSQDVLKCFIKKLKEVGVEIRYETPVTQILVNQELGKSNWCQNKEKEN